VHILPLYTKGLKVWWQDATLFCLFFIFLYHTYIHTIHLSVAIRWGLSPSPHRLKAQWEDPPCGAEPRIELGPALQQADALPTEPRRTITEPRRTPSILTPLSVGVGPKHCHGGWGIEAVKTTEKKFDVHLMCTVPPPFWMVGQELGVIRTRTRVGIRKRKERKETFTQT
jgi:hypothetical protein